jgi:hypothetical protein
MPRCPDRASLVADEGDDKGDSMRQRPTNALIFVC